MTERKWLNSIWIVALVGYFVVGVGYLLWSYLLTDGNLILTQWSVYWQWQLSMWQLARELPQIVNQGYLTLVVILYLLYFLIIRFVPDFSVTLRSPKLLFKLVGIWSVIILPLIFAYNAHSHDLFNYIFNARMVVEYQANPHEQVALDFAFDPWTRFMHNTHTPAPYFYGWTGLSLIPYVLGFGKFLTTWLAFKVFAYMSLVLLFFVLIWVAQCLSLPLKLKNLSILFFNPLLLMEILGNAHNDIWMMVLAIISIGLLLGKRITKLTVFLSLVILLLSASIKYSTLIFLPIWMGVLFVTNWNIAVTWLKKYHLFDLLERFFGQFLISLTYLFKLSLPMFGVLLMFLPLLTERSRYFLPWYLTWSLSWLPLLMIVKPAIRPQGVDRVIKLFVKLGRVLVSWLIAFSLSSALRYLPWLAAREYSDKINAEERLITWIGGISIFVLIELINSRKGRVQPDTINS